MVVQQPLWNHAFRDMANLVETRVTLPFSFIKDSTLEQGDLLLQCPAFKPIFSKGISLSDLKSGDVHLKVGYYDLIIMTQTCDLVEGREKIKEVLLCQTATKSEIAILEKHPIKSASNFSNMQKFKMPGFHPLNAVEETPCSREEGAVLFSQAYTLPIELLRDFASQLGLRPRLNSPYREKLSQRYGEYFSRIALPD